MDILGIITEFEIVGNKLWRILALFGIILIVLLLGKITKFVLQRSATRFESRRRFMTATTLNAIGRGVVILFAAAGISLGIASLELKAEVAEFFSTLSSILLSMAIAYMVYWLVDVPTKWLAKMAGKTESKLDDMLVPIVRKSLRVTVVVLLPGSDCPDTE
jgi:MscS family membrane protein